MSKGGVFLVFALGLLPQLVLATSFADILAHARRTGTREIVLASGVYDVPETVRFGPDDSGLTIRAAHPGEVILSGACTLDWHRPSAGEWAARPLSLVRAAARKALLIARVPGTDEIPGFRQAGCVGANLAKFIDHPPVLFQNGERLTIAQAPDVGRFSRTRFLGESKTHGVWYVWQHGLFEVLDDTARARLVDWTQEPDLYAHGLWCYKWADARLPITNVCPEKGVMALDDRSYAHSFRNNQEYYVFNAFSEITQPGEWAIDRTQRFVALWPRANEPAQLAWTPTLLHLVGATNVTLSGIVFQNARAHAIVADKCKGLVLEKSIVRRTGGWGVRIMLSYDSRVQGCDLYDLGEGGVCIEGGVERTLLPGGNCVDNCHIHHYGKAIANYRPGISLNGVGNVATHNLIHHADHQGLSFRGQDHRFAFNVVHDTCMHNDDAGAFYTCQYDTWQSLGTTFEYNLVHETGDHPHPTNVRAVYLDDWSSGARVRHNILSRASEGVQMGGGMFTEVVSNVIVRMINEPISFASRGTNSFARAEALKGRNSGKYRRMLAMRPILESPAWRAKHPEVLKWYEIEDPYRAHDALFTLTRDNLGVCCGNWTSHELKYLEALAQWNVWTNNVCIAEDPGFVDYEHLDFAAKKGARYEGLIAACRFPEMGLYASDKRISPPVKYGAGVTYPGPLRHDLENAVVRMDVVWRAKLPASTNAFATSVMDCAMPLWGKGMRLSAEFGVASDAWRDYAFAFTPCVDGKAALALMGLYGEKTEYASISVTGAELSGTGGIANHAQILELPLVLHAQRTVTVRFRARTAQVTASSAGTVDFTGTNASAKFIQRTMHKLAFSTKAHPADVKILFYGQSSVEGDWYKRIVDDLRCRFPTARIDARNAAIGGFEAPNLVKMLRSDVYSFYPDLIFIQDWGAYEQLSAIFKEIRANTTAEIVMWTSHVRSKQSLQEALREEDAFSKTQCRIACENDCMMIHLKRKWAKYHLDHGYPAAKYMSSDGVHLTAAADKLYTDLLKEELVVLDDAETTPAAGSVRSCPFRASTKRLADGSLEFSFTGNRVEAIACPTVPTYRYASSPVKILLDGCEMAQMKELYATTRPFGLVCWMPVVLRVGFDVVPIAEDWTLTFLAGTAPGGMPVRYRVDGSVTGFDGEGVSTEDFVSKSGRVKIAANDFFSWQFDYFYTQRKMEDRAALPGQWIGWQVVRNFTDRLGTYLGPNERVLVVSGCANGPHKLTFVPALPSKPPALSELVVYQPAGKAKPPVAGKAEGLKRFAADYDRSGANAVTSLVLRAGKAVAEKVWNFRVEPGKAMRFSVKAEYRALDGKPAFNDLLALASWVDSRAGKRHENAGLGVCEDPTEHDPGANWKYWQRDYLRYSDVVREGVTVRTFSDTLNVPTNCPAVDVEVFVKARECEAEILEVKAQVVPQLPKRVARIALANPRRGGPSTIAARGRQVVRALDEVFARVEHPDFVMACSEGFPESVNRDPKDLSEPVPEGPTSQILSRYAKAHQCYVAGGLRECCKDGIVRNAVVLFDRAGRYAGTYYKVHLTTGEFLEGMVAGNEFKVFNTDFGRIGFCICWDNFFPETMRQLQLNGAELVIFPLACTNAEHHEYVFRARAIDTGLPLAVQIRQGKQSNRIIGRHGEVIAEATAEYEPCWADIDLSARARTWWLSVGDAYGDPYQLYDAERRPELYR